MEEGLRLQGQFVDDVDNVIDEHLGEPAGRSPAVGAVGARSCSSAGGPMLM